MKENCFFSYGSLERDRKWKRMLTSLAVVYDGWFKNIKDPFSTHLKRSLKCFEN